MRGVPETLRAAFERVSQGVLCSVTLFRSASPVVYALTPKGDMDIHMEHPYKIMTCTHIDLEKYVLFMQVGSKYIC